MSPFEKEKNLLDDLKRNHIIKKDENKNKQVFIDEDNTYKQFYNLEGNIGPEKIDNSTIELKEDDKKNTIMQIYSMLFFEPKKLIKDYFSKKAFEEIPLLVEFSNIKKWTLKKMDSFFSGCSLAFQLLL